MVNVDRREVSRLYRISIPFRPKRLHIRLIAFQERSADEVDAIGDGWENGL